MADSHNFIFTPLRYLGVTIGLLVVFALGCGSEKEASQTVTPPPLTTQTEQPTSEPPGTMEMPKEIQAVTPADPKSTGGIEMPDVKDSTSSGTSSNIQFASWGEVDQLATSAGKVTVVDIWSVGCQPCIRELPGLQEIHQSMGAKVQCIALDIDYYGSKRRPPESFQEDVAKVIGSIGATFTTYICSTPDKDVYSKVDFDSIPAVLVYDAGGKLVKKFVDSGEQSGFTYHKDVIPFVNNMLK